MLITRTNRHAKALVLVALLLPALFGMIGLFLDCGLLLTAHRQMQAATDSAAQAAAQELLNGGSVSMAETAARDLLKKHAQLDDAQLIVRTPPTQGDHAGDANFVEVLVTCSRTTWLMPVVGGERNQTISARAVAGIRRLPDASLLCALDPALVPGLSIPRGNVILHGRASVNSPGSGVDEKGNFVDRGCGGTAIELNGNLSLERLDVVGGIEVAANLFAFPETGQSPLRAGRLPRHDGLRHLETPTIATGIQARYPSTEGLAASPQNVAITLTAEEAITLEPGIYASIHITGEGPGSVTFQPGIYVLAGGNTEGVSLLISTAGKVTGDGVLFYNTGSEFDPATGLPDRSNENGTGAERHGTMTIQGGDITLRSLNDSASPYHGLLLYQRRASAKPIVLKDLNTSTILDGAVYAPAASLQLQGEGLFRLQVLTGTASLGTVEDGQSLEITTPTRSVRSPLVYLVE